MRMLLIIAFFASLVMSFDLPSSVKNSRWEELWPDINGYASSHSGSSNRNFAQGLYDLLADKYYWKHWLVVAYNPIHGYDNHCVRQCGGYIKFRTYGRNFIVASVDSTTSTIDRSYARWSLGEVDTHKRKVWGRYYGRRDAEDVYDNLHEPSGTCSVGVIRCGSDVGYGYGPSDNRFESKSRCPDYEIFIWG